MNTRLRSILCTVVISGQMAFAPCHAVDLNQRLDFDIPPQALSSALIEFSHQAKIQVVTGNNLASLTTAGVSGSHAIREALTQLLIRSGLSYRVAGDSSITIGGAGQAAEAGTSSGKEGSAVQLAQTEMSPPAQGEGRSEDRKESPGLAGSSEVEKGKISEIVVTAQKRKENLQDVPIAITVLTGEDLDRSTFEGVTEALRTVPGVAANVAVQSGGTQVAVRGVTSATPTVSGSSPIAYYLDSVPLGLVKTSIFPDANAYDLERIEVLRGPQGTLYGSSALNGVVRILSENPDLDEFKFKARSSASATEQGEESYRADLAVNVPIVSGRLAARAVIGYQDLGGWIDRPNNRDANSAEIANARLKVGAQPTDDLSMVASAWISRSDYNEASISPDNRQISDALHEPNALDFDAYSFTINYDFDNFSISSATSYLKFSNDGFLTQNFALGRNQQSSFSSNAFSQEINIGSTDAGPWRWSVGAIYRDVEDRTFGDIPGAVPAPTDLTDASTSYAVYGEVTRLFLGGQWELTGGLRYFEDQLKSREDSNSIGTAPAGVFDRPQFDALTPRVVLTWHPADEVSLYASYAEGFRSGFSQVPSLTAAGIQPVRPDSLANYELGVKGSLWDRRLRFDTAVFYIDWQDVQQSMLIGIGPGGGAPNLVGGINSGSASGMGFELGGSVELTDGLTFAGNFSWNDLTFDSDVFMSSNIGLVLLFSSGERLNFSSEYTAGASLDYAFPMGSGGFQGRLTASANYHSEMESRRGLASGAVQVAPGDAMLIGRTSFTVEAPNDRWKLVFFVDNVNNEEGAIINNWSGIASRDVRVRPRTVGLQLEFRM